MTSEEPVIGKADTFLLGQSRNWTNAKVDSGWLWVLRILCNTSRLDCCSFVRELPVVPDRSSPVLQIGDGAREPFLFLQILGWALTLEWVATASLVVPHVGCHLWWPSARTLSVIKSLLQPGYVPFTHFLSRGFPSTNPPALFTVLWCLYFSGW